MRTTLEEVKNEDNETIGWIQPRRIEGQVTYEYVTTAYVGRTTLKRTFTLYRSAKSFIETGKVV